MKQGSGFFVVDPTLKIGPENEILPLDCICLQTVLAKSLGPFPQWEQRLQVGRETYYNVLHFTPLQELGASESSYSLRNQDQLNPVFNNDGKKITYQDVGDFVTKLNMEWHMLSITDVVWNHSSFDSPWIHKHPECSYNMVNSPHLKPAYLLDRILWHFTLDVIAGKWEHKGVPKVINHDNHLQAIRSVLLCDVLPQYKLSEFVQVNVDESVKQFRQLAAANAPTDEPSDVKVEIIQDCKYRRLCSTVDFDKALKVFNQKRKEAETEEERLDLCCSDFRNKLYELNGVADYGILEDIKHAINNVICGASYHFTQPDGPKYGAVSKTHPLVP
ncbi:glycogen debranching enzyme-like, partial [Saccoglossus kowalevskii]